MTRVAGAKAAGGEARRAWLLPVVPVFGMACSALALRDGISLPLLGATGLILGGIGVGAIK